MDPLTAPADTVEWLVDVSEPLADIGPDKIQEAHTLLTTPTKTKEWSAMDYAPSLSADGSNFVFPEGVSGPLQTGNDFVMKLGIIKGDCHVVEASSSPDRCVYDMTCSVFWGLLKNRVCYELVLNNNNDGVVMGRAREVKPGLASVLTPSQKYLQEMHRANLKALNAAFQQQSN